MPIPAPVNTSPTPPVKLSVLRGPLAEPTSCPTSPCLVDQRHLSPAGRERVAKMLVKDYEDMSWSSNANQKQIVLDAMVTVQSETVAAAIVKDYEDNSWSSNATRKRSLLAALVATGSDLAADSISKDYEDVSWWSNATIKLELLNALKKLTALGTCPTPAP